MNVYWLILLVHSSVSVPIQMTGELDIQLVQNQVGLEFRGNKKKADSLVLQLDQKNNATTSKPGCIYQYPKRKQVDALLSNMMNVLTKIVVRVREYLEAEDAKSARGAGAGAGLPPAGDAEGGGQGAGDAKGLEAMRARRPAAPERPRSSRFRVVSGQPQRYFDEIYTNMTLDYKKFYHERSGSVLLRAGPNPCSHQPAIRRLWLELLASSQASLRRAALRCVRHRLHAGGPRANDAKLKSRLGMFLLKEFTKLRSLQLDTLCDQFRLCYQDLL